MFKMNRISSFLEQTSRHCAALSDATHPLPPYIHHKATPMYIKGNHRKATILTGGLAIIMPSGSVWGLGVSLCHRSIGRPENTLFDAIKQLTFLGTLSDQRGIDTIITNR